MEAEGTHLIASGATPPLSIQSYYLEMIRGPEVGRRWPLKEAARVGKGLDNDVAILDATVSRHHFSLERYKEGYSLRDLGSTNGTFINNTRVVEAFVFPGMEIRAGDIVFFLKAEQEGIQITPSGKWNYGELVGKSDPIRRIFALLEKVSPSDATVLITGETGTGKGAVARCIHDKSHRVDFPFVTLDCGSISRLLIESELFGHEKGAFTDAHQQRRGALETCQQGTLFIDELDDLPLEVQPKLLRALDKREICRLGSNKSIKLDLRVVAATKRNLRQEVAEGRFREDLYYRLSVVTLTLPPLRDRLEDLPLLTGHFCNDPHAWERLPQTIREQLLTYTFPGNLRELRNLLERATYLDGFENVDPQIFPFELKGGLNHLDEFKVAVDYRKPFKQSKELLVNRFEFEYLHRLLLRAANNLSKAAKDAEIDRKYLYQLLNKHHIRIGEE